MDWQNVDWDILKKLRETFLSDEQGVTKDYWESEPQLAHYDLTFGQRIGWKWDAVLREVRESGWTPGADKPWILDWGCGTGVAARRFLDFFPADSFSGILLWDRSAMARAFAKKAVSLAAGNLPVQEWSGGTELKAPVIVLLSHVLNELHPEEAAILMRLLSQARSVFWLEPGTPSLSRKLIEVRENLRGDFNIVAPCPHQDRCGLLTGDNAPHWCHHFAEPPDEIFHHAGWAQFNRVLGVDLRSLPASFLVLQRKQAGELTANEKGARIVGRARHYKGYANVLTCDSGGVRETKLLKRDNAELLKRLKKNRFTTLIPTEEP